jgi:enoyl-CoA hydratase/carnithine racemase
MPGSSERSTPSSVREQVSGWPAGRTEQERGAALTQDVEITAADGVARLTLCRPGKRNAITAEMWEAIIRGLDAARSKPGMRALLIQGSGGSFCAGGDLGSVRLPDGSESQAFRALVAQGLARIRDFPFATAAFIDGPCIGGGCNIALACDVRFATPPSTFAIPAVRYSLVFEEAGLRRLVELVGSGHAYRLLLSGATIGGTEAASIGLVEHCSDAAAAECDRYLADLARAYGPTAAATRQLIRSFAGLDSVVDDGSRPAAFEAG